MLGSVPFIKMNGCGNDFIVIDNRSGRVEGEQAGFARGVCRRGLSIGADGLILIENSARHDFRWRFFNTDGSRAEMCGNGARCAARFAHHVGIAGRRMTFETDAGPIEAEVDGADVRIRMTTPSACRIDYPIPTAEGPLAVSSINTGVPHVVVERASLKEDIVPLGREIRYHAAFAPAGANVNFMMPIGGNHLAVRTYERGVEDETLACGTGSVAAALVTAVRRGWASPIAVTTRSGGILTIHFQRGGDAFREVYLEGDARIVCTGEIHEDALRP